jgi:hypothetical protein
MYCKEMKDQELIDLYEAYASIYETSHMVGPVEMEKDPYTNPKTGKPHTYESRKDALDKRKGKDRMEEVEAWVNDLVEEGYDLSEYTWDDMYEIYMEEVENLEEARRADREGHERGTAANPTRAQTDVPHSDPSQRTRLHSKFRRRSDEMGRVRRSSARNRSGGRTPVSAKEKAFLQAGDRTSPGRGHVRSPNVGDTGRHSDEGRYDREDKKNPKLNPRHNANRENAAESFDLFDTILEHLVAEGYADTNEAALAIMANMSGEWRESIVEGLKSIDTPEKANQYAMKALGSATKAAFTKDKKTYEKRMKGLKMGQRKAERKAAEEN